MDKILEALFQYLSSNPVDFIFYSTLILVSTWIFVNIKQRMDSIENSRNEKTHCALKSYYELIFLLRNYQNNEDNENNITDCISSIIPYVSTNFAEKLLEWKSSDINTIIINLESMIKELKSKQYNTLHFEEITFEKQLLNFFNESGLKNIITSGLYTLIGLIIFLFLFLMIVSTYGKSNFEIMYVILNILYFGFIFFDLIFTIDIYTLKKFELPLCKWLIILFIILFPFLLILKFTDIINKIISVTFIIIHIITLFIFIPKIINKHKNK